MSGGTLSKPFSGTFDGAGNTITVSISDGTNQGTAPFCYIKGAKIKNLTVQGSVTGTTHAAGLVGFSDGTDNLIQDCIVKTNVTGGSHIGGVLGHGKGSSITIEGCVYDGLFTNGGSAKGAIFGWGDNGGTKTVDNCLYVMPSGQSSNTSGLDLARMNGGSVTVTNSYKTTDAGTYGTKVSADVQTDFCKKVYTYNNKDYYTTEAVTINGVKGIYIYTGSEITVAPTSVTYGSTTLANNEYTYEISPATVKEKGTYTITITGAGNYHGSVSQNFQVIEALAKDNNGNYLIKDADDWNTFVYTVNNDYSYSGETVKLSDSFDNSNVSISTMAGTSAHPFSGTFDGAGRTLTVSINDGNNQGTAPFCYIKGATIKRLTVTGTVTGTTHAAGLVGFSDGTSTSPNTIEDCIVNVSVTHSGTGSGHIGGVVGHGKASYLKIKNTVFGGTMSNSSDYAGGLMGWSDNSHLTIENCLFKGSYSYTGSGNNKGFHPVAICNNSANITKSVTDCYYINTAAPTLTEANHIAVAGTPVSTTAPSSGMYDTVTAADNKTYYVTCYDLTVNTATGGTVAVTVGGQSTTTAKQGDIVTLTVTPESGYVLSGISVTDANGNAVAANGGWYTNNQATFTMPASAVTVTPTFTNDLSNLYINMPKTGTQTVTIPTGVQSFKVYDDGGASGYYSNRCSGYLTLTAPEGYLLQLSGSINTQSSMDYLTVYDGSNNSASKLLDAVSSTSYGTETAITTVTSTGQSMTLYFYSDGGTYFAGLDLTVTLVPITYTVSFNKNNDDATGTMAAQNFTYDAAQALTANTYTRTGYTFAGWATTADGDKVYDDQQSVSNLASTQGANVELFAKWTPTSYTINCDLAGGSVTTNNPTSYTIESEDITLNNPTRTGYTFAGWTGTELNGATIDVTIAKGSMGNRSYTATWTKNELILFDDDSSQSDGSKNADIISAASGDGKQYAVTLSGRTLYKDGAWNTLCLPFNLTLDGSILQGAVARTVTEAYINRATLYLTFGDPVSTLTAGTPYIIKWDGDGSDNLVNPVFTGVTISNADNGYDTDKEDVITDARLQFLGTYAAKTFGNEDKSILLMGGNNSLYYPQNGARIGAQRAFFKLGDGAEVRSFRMNFGEETTTAIVSIEDGELKMSDGWYDLNGRKLNTRPTLKGIYINHGRKVVVK